MVAFGTDPMNSPRTSQRLPQIYVCRRCRHRETFQRQRCPCCGCKDWRLERPTLRIGELRYGSIEVDGTFWLVPVSKAAAQYVEALPETAPAEYTAFLRSEGGKWRWEVWEPYFYLSFKTGLALTRGKAKDCTRSFLEGYSVTRSSTALRHEYQHLPEEARQHMARLAQVSDEVASQLGGHGYGNWRRGHQLAYRRGGVAAIHQLWKARLEALAQSWGLHHRGTGGRADFLAETQAVTGTSDLAAYSRWRASVHLSSKRLTIEQLRELWRAHVCEREQEITRALETKHARRGLDRW